MTQVYDFAEGLPIPKRLKSHYEPNYDAFQRGSIIRCKLSNFMSYSLTEFHFGPKMNLIIGPNGSGKSTFVCAVCIGLNGKLANLGKESMSTDSFIKDNAEMAKIELELKGEDSGSVVVTTILKKGKKTTWKIDNRSATESDIKKLLKSFNIQLDNLCQFLSQDRVSKFADLKSEDLLKEIERSYGNGELLKEHNEIIKLQANINLQRKQLNDSTDELKDLAEKRASLQDRVDKYLQYRKLQDDLEKTELIRPYVKFQDKKAEQETYRELFKEAQLGLKEFEERIEPITEAAGSSDKLLLETEKKITDLNEMNNSIGLELKKLNEKIGKQEQKIAKYVDAMEDSNEKLTNAKLRYQKLLENFQSIHSSLEQVPDINPEDLKEWKDKSRVLREAYDSLDDEISTLRGRYNSYEQQLKNLDFKIKNERKKLNSTDRLYQLDHRKYKKVIDGVNYLRSYKENGPNDIEFCEPGTIKLNVKQKELRNIVEALVPYSHMNAVIVKNKTDFDKLSNYLYDEKKNTISIRTLGANEFDISTNRLDIDTIKQLGFDGYMTDYLEGPEELIQMLCENAHLNCIPVSIKGLTNQQKSFIGKEVEKGLNLVKYVSSDQILTMNRSKYGRRQVSTNIKPVKTNGHSIFSDGLSDSQKIAIQDTIQKLEVEYNQISDARSRLKEDYSHQVEESARLKQEDKEINVRIDECKEVSRRRSKLESKLSILSDQLKAQKVSIKQIKEESNDSNKGKVFEKIEQLLKEKTELESKARASLLNKRIHNDSLLIRLHLAKMEEENKIKSVQSLLASIQKEKDEKVENINKTKQLYETSKNEYVKLYNSYKERVQQLSYEAKQDMKKIIEEMVEDGQLTEDRLDTRIEQIKSDMSLNNRSGSEASMKQLKETEERIAELESSLPLVREELESNESIIKGLCANWEQKLDEIVEVISRDFDDNMRKIASAGNVKLDKTDEDFNRWKLIIQVSFRDSEPLSDFNGAQHSGGEKSTTTAVFLNSLQGLTNTPFRVVDEINQGMDAKNERKAHELIVKRATDNSVNASQYFLITPKLLSNLFYGPDMTVHCIYAGRWCPMPSKSTGSQDAERDFLEIGVCSQYVK